MGAIVCGKPIHLTDKMGGFYFIYLFLNLHMIQNYPKAMLVISSYVFHLANSTQAVYILLELFIFHNYDLPLRIWQWIIHILPTIEIDI